MYGSGSVRLMDSAQTTPTLRHQNSQHTRPKEYDRVITVLPYVVTATSTKNTSCSWVLLTPSRGSTQGCRATVCKFNIVLCAQDHGRPYPPSS